MTQFLDDSKYDDTELSESGTWSIAKSQMESMINSSSNDRRNAVSPIIYNKKKQVIFRISLTAYPSLSNSHSVELYFNLQSSIQDNNDLTLQLQCSSPYFSKMNDTDYSLSQSVDKSTLLSNNTTTIQYTIKPNTSNRCFSARCNSNQPINNSIYYCDYQIREMKSLLPHSLVFNNSNALHNDLPSNYKPISFECSVDSTILTEIRTKINDSSQYSEAGCYRLKCIRDRFTNTTYDLYLVGSSTSQPQYSLYVQPHHSRADEIYAFVGIECPDIMFYESRVYDFSRSGSGNHQFEAEQVVSLPQRFSHEKVIRFKGLIFGQKWMKWSKNTCIDLTTQMFGASLMTSNNDDITSKKINEMSLQMQQLTVGLNRLLSNHTSTRSTLSSISQCVNGLNQYDAVQNKLVSMSQTLNNMNTRILQIIQQQNTNQNQDINGKLDSVLKALKDVSSHSMNDDEKSNDNAVFDPAIKKYKAKRGSNEKTSYI